MSKNIYTKIKAFISSNWFLGTVIALFAAESIWLAINSKFQMAFDEAHHFGLIQFFASHPNPWVTHQPASSYKLGALSHDPSFLYHLLMTLPYRLLTLFTHDLKFIVISLRFINIGLALVNLIVIKKLLNLIKMPSLVSNLIILAFAFTPMVSVLSAQINYDNLVILLVSLGTYQTVKFVKQLKVKKFDLKLLLTITCLALCGCLVKYSFVAVALGILGIVSINLWLYVKNNHLKLRDLLAKSFRQDKLLKLSLATLACLGLIGVGMFYGFNLVKFHNPVPSCEQVLSTQSCGHYYVWVRNHALAAAKQPGQPIMSVPSYALLWLKEMYYQIFAEIIPTGGLVPIEHAFRLTVYGLTAIGTLCLLFSWKKIFSKNATKIMLAISLGYLLVLLARNYHDYLNLGQPVAIQGRFLLPILIYIYVLLAYGFYYFLTSNKLIRQVAAPVLISLLIGSFIYWGGYSQYTKNVSPDFHWSKVAKLDFKAIKSI